MFACLGCSDCWGCFSPAFPRDNPRLTGCRARIYGACNVTSFLSSSSASHAANKNMTVMRHRVCAFIYVQSFSDTARYLVIRCAMFTSWTYYRTLARSGATHYLKHFPVFLIADNVSCCSTRQPRHPMQAEATIRTRKFISNPLLGRKQCVSGLLFDVSLVLHPSSFRPKTTSCCI